MTVTVLWFGPLRDRTGRHTDRVEVASGTTLAALLEQLVSAPRPPCGYARNGEHADGDTVVEDGDEVVFLPPVGGG